MKRAIIFFLPIIVYLTSCNLSYDTESISGNWKVISVDYPQFSSNQEIQSNYRQAIDEQYLDSRIVLRQNGIFEIPDDKFDDVHLTGSWHLSLGNIVVDFDKGTGTEYTIISFDQSKLILQEDDITLELTRLPNYRPKNDTIKFDFTGPKSDFQLFSILDATANKPHEPISYVSDSSSYFIFIQSPYLNNYDLEHYEFEVDVRLNGTLFRTARKNQYELQILKQNRPDSVRFEFKISYYEDSIIALGFNQGELTKPDTSFVYPTETTYYIPIK